MAGEWESVPLGQLIEPGRNISYGIVQPGSPTHDGVPIIRVSDVRDGFISTSNPLRVSAEIEAPYARTRLRGGELLLTLVGTVGEAAIAPRSLAGWNTARAIAVIPIQKEIGAYWVKIAFQSPVVRELINGRLNTTVQATLNLRDVAELPITLPPARERGAIIETISALDDKIELNRRMAETLEAMARALFRGWFVDFDPVRAKAAGRPTGLPDDLAALFPDRFGDDELPTGFERRALGSSLVKSVVRGLAPAYAAEGILTLNQKCIRNGRIGLSEARRHDPGRRRVGDERLIQAGDVVINSTGVGTLGRVAQVRRLREQMTADSHVTIVRPSTANVSENFLGMSLLQMEPLIETLGHGSTGQTELARETVNGLEVVIANERIRQAFDRTTVPLRDRSDAALEEAETLATLRNTLLPKLISGELRIEDAERRTAIA
jgi:type I restriction enzyme, S subunit